MKDRSWRCLIILAVSAALSGGFACDTEEGSDDGEELPEVDCGAVEVPRFEAMSVWSSCVGCHSSTLSGAGRQGAPSEFNYDSHEEALFDPLETAESVVDAEMPPSGPLRAEEIELISIWAQCGAP